ncbi:hypothetical protein ACQ4M3_11665 [Leptolyngbya sp. AN03gr2]|uniref:hypothetical protein n=1 Tax=unclassified Leptolyngbya TaxID=2650499 RepID=UPI003D320B88
MLHSKILALKQENSRFSIITPVLDAISLDTCQEIDCSATDSFLTEKKRNILNYLKRYDVGYDCKLKAALDEHNEAALYLLFQNKSISIERVCESNHQKTPDFKILLEGKSFFLEMKTLGFAQGDLNYIDALDKGLDARVSLEQQSKSGKRVAIAEVGFDPLQSQKPDYLLCYGTYFIDTIVQKIKQNLKKQQFELGETILLIDLCLIDTPFGHKLNSIAFFHEPILKSVVSGLLWHTAFGSLGERVFTPIRFEGASNIEGQLKTEGILREFAWIKALCFQTYNVSRERAIVGFYRSSDEDLILPLLSYFCDFTNDDLNSNAWRILQSI